MDRIGRFRQLAIEGQEWRELGDIQCCGCGWQRPRIISFFSTDRSSPSVRYQYPDTSAIPTTIVAIGSLLRNELPHNFFIFFCIWIQDGGWTFSKACLSLLVPLVFIPIVVLLQCCCYRDFCLIVELSVKSWLKCDFKSVFMKSPTFIQGLNSHAQKSGVRLLKTSFLACHTVMGGPSWPCIGRWGFRVMGLMADPIKHLKFLSKFLGWHEEVLIELSKLGSVKGRANELFTECFSNQQSLYA